VFLFDGDCAFCSGCARFIQRHIPSPAVVVAWQFADLARLGLTPAECDEAVQWIQPGHRASGPAAISALLRSSRWPWRLLGTVMDRRPVLALAWPVYRWVSRNRHRLPGGTPVCSLPADQRPLMSPVVTTRTKQSDRE
jgi:predicted DCC family thiol-disulfide oxidoreductase YuxK